MMRLSGFGVQPGREVASASAWMVVIGALAVSLAALVVRMGLLSASPEFDELYHLLAARSLDEAGTLAIADGEYTRASLYTRIVAGFFALSGQDSLEVGRWVSLLPGLLLPVVLFVWLRGLAGWLAAGIAAGFAVLWPQAIIESQLLRFYSTHVLLFFLGAICAYGAVEAWGRQRWALAALSVLCLGLASAFQVTTAVGIAGLALWLTGVIILRLPLKARGRWLALGGVVLAGLAVLALAYATGLLDKAIRIYRFAPGHSEPVKDYVGFYHNALRNAYETFWPLFPVAVILAHRVRPQLTWFCASIFLTALVVHSFGGMKSGRYLSYIMPFFFTLWGLALASIAEPLWAALRRMLGGRNGLAMGVLGGATLFALTANGFVVHSAKLALGKGYISRGDWRPAAALVEDWSDLPFVMTTHELHMLTYVGDYDLLLSYSRVTEMSDRAEFVDDPRTGRPVITSPEALQQVLACKREGVMLTQPGWWDTQPETQAMEAALQAEGLEVERRVQGEMLALRWSDPAGRAPVCALPIDLD